MRTTAAMDVVGGGSRLRRGERRQSVSDIKTMRATPSRVGSREKGDE